MVKAVFNNQVIAESNDTVVVDRRHYFPEKAVKKDVLKPTDYRTTCPWKGEAHYFDLKLGDQKQIRGAFHYPDPKPEAEHIRKRIAFQHGVDIINESDDDTGKKGNEKPWYES